MRWLITQLFSVSNAEFLTGNLLASPNPTFSPEHAAIPQAVPGQLQLRAFVPAEASAFLSWFWHSSTRIGCGSEKAAPRSARSTLSYGSTVLDSAWQPPSAASAVCSTPFFCCLHSRDKWQKQTPTLH